MESKEELERLLELSSDAVGFNSSGKLLPGSLIN